ncbi:MAG: hypothetical protein J3Q66DRAFT_388165 [Benniella sp.]|nr:MAG: hypothetical protein J3Q66DRAFT_388165 [Benniella sp.]
MSLYPRVPLEDQQRSNHPYDNTPHPLTHFHEGHLPVYSENADWSHFRNPTKQSTGSVSSFRSWSSEDPAFSSHTSSLTQYTPPHSQLIQSPPFPKGQRVPSPRVDSLLSTLSSVSSVSSASSASGRYLSTTANSQSHTNSSSTHSVVQGGGGAKHHHNDNVTSYNSHFGDGHPHSPDTLRRSSQSSSQGHQDLYHSPQQPRYRPHSHQQLQQQQQPLPQQLQQQQQQQPQQTDMSYRDQRGGGTGEQQDLSEKSSSQRPSRAPVADVFQLSPSSPGQESPRTMQRAQRRRGEPAAAQQETEFRSLDDYEAMLQEMTSPALGPKDGRATTTTTSAAPPRRQERDARADRSPRPPRRQPQQQEPEQQQGSVREQRPRLQPRQTPDQEQRPSRAHHHADQLRTMNISVPSQYQTSKLSSLGLDPAFDERKLKRRSSLPSHLKGPTTTDTTTTDGLTSSVQRRNSDDQQLLSSTLAVELSVSNDSILSRKGTALNRPNGGHYHHHQGGAAPLVHVQRDYSALSSSVPPEPKRFSWENESVTTRADLLQGHDIRPRSLQRKGSWLQPLSDESPESEQSTTVTVTAATATAPEGRHAQPLRTGSQNSLNGSQPATPTGPSSLSRSHSPMSVEASTQQQQQQQQPSPSPADNDDYLSDGGGIPVPKGRRPSRSTGTRSRPNTPVSGIRPPPGPAPASASSGIVQISRKVSPPSKKRSGSVSNTNMGGSGSSSAGNGGGKLGSPSSSSSDMLQPIVRGTRPRAASSASVSTLGSVGSIIVLDRSLTPPAPSSPLPSLPPPPPHHVPPPRIPLPPLEGPAAAAATAGGVIGLGLDPLPVRTRKASGGKDQLFSAVSAAVAAVPPLPPQVVLNAEGARTHDSDLMAQLEAMRAQLAERDEMIAQLKAEQRTRRPSVQKVGLMEQELVQAKHEIQRLQGVMEEKEQNPTTTTTTTMATTGKQQQQQAARQQALVSEMEALKQTHQVQEKARLALEQEVLQLRSEKTRQEERLEAMERELSTLKARSEQETLVHTRTLQDHLERWNAQKMHLESQHTKALTDLTERHQKEKETLVETTTRQERMITTNTTLALRRRHEEKTAETEAETEAREKVLRDRLLEQASRYDQLADAFFQMEKTLATTIKEKETMARTNRSLERHLSMQHLQEQENLYRKEELERENAELRELVSELDMAVARTLSQQQQQQQHNEEVEGGALTEEEKEKKKNNGGELDREQQMMATFEQQYRKWNENAELMAQKLARAEDETRKVLAQNEKLQVALELSHTNRQSPSARSPTPSA